MDEYQDLPDNDRFESKKVRRLRMQVGLLKDVNLVYMMTRKGMAVDPENTGYQDIRYFEEKLELALQENG